MEFKKAVQNLNKETIMTDEKIELPEKSIMILTFIKGKELPEVKMTNHYNINVTKMQLAVDVMNRVFWNTVNRIGHERGKERREGQIQRAADRINPIQARLDSAILASHTAAKNTLQNEMTENENAGR